MKDSKITTTIPEYLSRATRSIILRTVYENPGISRNEIVTNTGYSGATITRVVEALINSDGLVEEKGFQHLPKGRPKKSLYFKGDNKYVIGIDLGTTYIRGVLADLNMEIYKEMEVVTEAHKNPEEVFEKVHSVIKSIQNTNLISNKNIIGVGLAIAGIVNTSTGIIEYSPAFNWRNINVEKLLGEKIKLPYLFDNVSRVMALGELNFGKGDEFDNFIMINVGFGIGSGIVVNKKLLYGTDGMAGEFGHVPVYGDERVQCSCGKHNCLTAYSSGDAIAKRAILKIKDGQDSILSKLCKNNHDLIDAKLVAEAYDLGDAVAIEVFKESTEYLGASIAGLLNVFNPQAIFIGGGVSLNRPAFWDNLKNSVELNCFNHRSTKYSLLPAAHPDKAALYGAVSLILNEVIKLNL